MVLYCPKAQSEAGPRMTIRGSELINFPNILVFIKLKSLSWGWGIPNKPGSKMGGGFYLGTHVMLTFTHEGGDTVHLFNIHHPL